MESWSPGEVIVFSAVIAAPVLLVVLVALIRGYSILFWRHGKGDRLPFVGIVRPDNPEEDDDAER